MSLAMVQDHVDAPAATETQVLRTDDINSRNVCCKTGLSTINSVLQNSFHLKLNITTENVRVVLRIDISLLSATRLPLLSTRSNFGGRQTLCLSLSSAIPEACYVPIQKGMICNRTLKSGLINHQGLSAVCRERIKPHARRSCREIRHAPRRSIANDHHVFAGRHLSQGRTEHASETESSK